MKAIIFVKKKKDETADPTNQDHTIDRRTIEKLEWNVEELKGVLRANLDLNTMKLYVEIDDESEEQPTKPDFIHAVQQGGHFSAVTVSIR